MRDFLSDYAIDGEYILTEAHHHVDEDNNTTLEFYLSLHDGENTASLNEGFLIPEGMELDPQAAEDYLEKIRLLRDALIDFVKEAEEATYKVVNPPSTDKSEVN